MVPHIRQIAPTARVVQEASEVSTRIGGTQMQREHTDPMDWAEGGLNLAGAGKFSLLL
jgi:hypothetical protein